MGLDAVEFVFATAATFATQHVTALAVPALELAGEVDHAPSAHERERGVTGRSGRSSRERNA